MAGRGGIRKSLLTEAQVQTKEYSGGQYYSMSLPQSAAQKKAAKERYQAKKAGGADWAAWQAESAARVAANRAALATRPKTGTTAGYFVHHAGMHGIQPTKEAITAVNRLTATFRKEIIHRATADAVRGGDSFVRVTHIMEAMGVSPGQIGAHVPKRKAPAFYRI